MLSSEDGVDGCSDGAAGSGNGGKHLKDSRDGAERNVPFQ